MKLQLNPLWRIFSGSDKLSNSFPDARLPQPSILFTSSFSSPFILDDLALLRSHFTVEHLLTRGPRSLVQIVQGVRRNDLMFTWFASAYSFVVVACARLLGKRSYIVIAGADVMGVEGVNYGPWRSPLKRIVVGWAIRHATGVLPVAKELRTAAMSLADYDGANAVVIPTGYDPALWFPSGPKERSVLCLAGCESRARLLVKGIDILFAAARELSNERFTIAGTRVDMLSALGQPVPPNVRVLPSMPREELTSLYHTAKVYVQPSRSEGLPNALCEAMLSGCVPVGADVGGVATVIGDTGYVVPAADVGALVGAIRMALEEPEERGARARQRICALFPAERREAALMQLLTGKHP
jgi:glycosyltransferase involved in cell wall biosynthesis